MNKQTGKGAGGDYGCEIRAAEQPTSHGAARSVRQQVAALLQHHHRHINC